MATFVCIKSTGHFFDGGRVSIWQNLANFYVSKSYTHSTHHEEGANGRRHWENQQVIVRQLINTRGPRRPEKSLAPHLLIHVMGQNGHKNSQVER
jgi:hypothetical protein